MTSSQWLTGGLHAGRLLAAGLLCAAAATVALWSGPLAAASRAFHTAGPAAHVALGHSGHAAS